VVGGRDAEIVEEAGRHQRVVVLACVDDDLFHSDTTAGTQDGGELGKVRSRPDDVEKSQN